MDYKKTPKFLNNDENEFPSTSKRFKPSPKLSISKLDEDTSEVFEDMGIGLLETDGSSSASSTTSSGTILPSSEDGIIETELKTNNNENLNETSSSKISINSELNSEYFHKIINSQQINSNCISENNDLLNNINFLKPNDALISTTHTTMLASSSSTMNTNYKFSNSNIEIYVDSDQNKILSSDKNHKKLVKSASQYMTKTSRSPLAIVACNNNLNNINNHNVNSNCANESMDSNYKKHSITPTATTTYTPTESFFLYKNRLQKLNNNGKDPFKRLSDEIILQILKWIPKKTLMRCSCVSKRFNRLAQDESLWTRLDLGGKVLRSGAVGKIISRGVVILRLAQSEILQPIFNPNYVEIHPEFQSKLQYLDLSMSVISKPCLKELLSKCRHLRKLSLEHVKLNDDICYEISKNCNLEAVNLAMCEGIESWSIQKIMSELNQLNSLNISWTSLNIESIQALVDNITPNLLRLNISGCRKAMFDSHLAILAKRCPELLELDLSDCSALTTGAIDILMNFQNLEYLSLSRCYGIYSSSFIKLKKLKSLQYLDIFGLLSEVALELFENTMSPVGINKFIYSSVARPTVGSRRTSIWGLRTRE